MRAFKCLLFGVLSAAIWPVYLGLMAYTARQAPWPRSLALSLALVLEILALACFAANLFSWLLRPHGWGEEVLRIPASVGQQLRHATLALIASAVVLLVPHWLLSQGLIAPGGRPISTPALNRFLVLGFELVVWGVVSRLVRGRSVLVAWLREFPDRMDWLNRRRRLFAWSILAALGALFFLDARGYSFTTRRLELGAIQTLLVLGLCLAVYLVVIRIIDHHAWRWIRMRHSTANSSGAAPSSDVDHPDDLADRLRRLTGYLVPVIGLLLTAWVWNVDLALFRFLAESPLFQIDHETPVTLGDFTKAAFVLLLSAAAWHHMSTFFAVTIFPRMPDDPGVRFAVVTLCRYFVVGLGAIAALSSIHLGLGKISVVLAALGVGLGFGLQEVVSNFVCGIILLLERPIRIGDIVTVAGTTGKVDRINIRATMIINGDNQSMIVPNREFITGNLVNWTHKDKIIRIPIHLNVAYGTDPDRVVDLLMTIARDDADVLRNPVPNAVLEGFGEACLTFGFYVFVPNPSLTGRVRHRLCTQVQARFAAEGIEIPFPTHELHLRSVPEDSALKGPPNRDLRRIDAASPIPPGTHLAAGALAGEPPYRGVDD